MRSVANGNPNDWGLTNYVGNAREWVTSDLGPEVQGASFKSALPECRYEHVDPSLGDPDDETGFRVMREL